MPTNHIALISLDGRKKVACDKGNLILFYNRIRVPRANRKDVNPHTIHPYQGKRTATPFLSAALIISFSAIWPPFYFV